jgi:hypothetical protein
MHTQLRLWQGGLWAALVLVSLVTGCGGGDDAEASGTTIVTNVVVSGGVTNQVFVTNTVAVADQAAAGDQAAVAGGQAANQALVAPQLLSPGNGITYITTADQPEVHIKFKWTAVPGAVNYVFTLDGVPFLNPADDTTFPGLVKIPGTHTWCVQVWDANREGPTSAVFTFKVTRLNISL